MKIDEGKWVAKSLDGKVRRFKELADAEHWKANHSKDILPAKELTLKRYLDQLDAIEADAAKAKHAARPDSFKIWNKFQTEVSNSFPDGDAIGNLAPWMQQHGLTIDDLNAAVKEHGDADDAYEYMAQMWQDHAADAEHDAMQGHRGETYDDEWFQRPNPWK